MVAATVAMVEEWQVVAAKAVGEKAGVWRDRDGDATARLPLCTVCAVGANLACVKLSARATIITEAIRSVLRVANALVRAYTAWRR